MNQGQKIKTMKKLIAEMRDNFVPMDDMPKTKRLRYAAYYTAFQTCLAIINTTMDEYDALRENNSDDRSRN